MQVVTNVACAPTVDATWAGTRKRGNSIYAVNWYVSR